MYKSSKIWHYKLNSDISGLPLDGSLLFRIVLK